MGSQQDIKSRWAGSQADLSDEASEDPPQSLASINRARRMPGLGHAEPQNPVANRAITTMIATCIAPWNATTRT